jgi:hypothetical protein
MNRSTKRKNKATDSVSTVETLIYDLETLFNVSETHNFIDA